MEYIKIAVDGFGGDNAPEEVVKGVNAVGTLPSWGATVDNETLSFSFNAGTLPTTKNSTVMTGASAASAQPTFTGTAGTVTVS